MKIDFTGRNILVTGSTSGIGFAAAKGFLEAGGQVVINGRSQGSVDAALHRLGSLAEKATGFAGDLSDETACQQLLAQHPDFDVVINNMGIFNPQDFFEIPDSEWQRFFDTNVMSGVRISRGYAPGMVERKWGASSSSLPSPRSTFRPTLSITASAKRRNWRFPEVLPKGWRAPA
jgi:NAD(P)-dependent dehydrogenase (short-subunit alcohol dehydrogenase family)